MLHFHTSIKIEMESFTFYILIMAIILKVRKVFDSEQFTYSIGSKLYKYQWRMTMA
jgi:hypothetical protein